MSMKKIIAGVAAAALTVGSLAVVGVSAEDDVRTFNFVGTTGTMKVTYSASASFVGGLPVDEVFTQPGGSEIDFNYSLQMGMQGGYKDTNLAAVQAILNTVKTGGGTQITVTGVDSNNRSITVTATADLTHDWNTVPVGYERIRIRKGTDGIGSALQSYDLDLTVFDKIRTVAVTNTFDFGTGNYYVPANTVFVNVFSSFASAAGLVGAGFDQYWAPYTTTSADSKGLGITVGQAYAFEGAAGDTEIEIGANGDGSPLYAISLGHNTLRWVNDNIVQNKGAKLRINFMSTTQLKDAITGGNITNYTTLHGGSSSNVLTPGSGTVTTTGQDITIGVNLKNTTKLQQSTNIENYCAEFDWDTLVHNSASTVSGNVDSIAFRVVGTDNVNKTIADNGVVAIRSIEIVIPDQTAYAEANDPARILTAGSPDAFVKLIGTEKTIFGNGAVEVGVENSITNNNVGYQLKLLDANGASVQLAGEVTLQLSIPTDFRGMTLSSDKVRHTCNDGTVEELAILNMDTYKTDNYIVVKTSKFSSFDFGFETEATEAPATEAPATEAPATEAPATEAPATEAPATEAPASNVGNASGSATADKNANTGVVLAVVPAAIAAAGVVISKKRK